MAKFIEFIEKDDLYECDSCKKTFKAKEIKLQEAADNIELLTPMMPIMFIDKDGVIVGDSKGPSKEKGDQTLACPHCNMTHLFGFNIVKAE